MEVNEGGGSTSGLIGILGDRIALQSLFCWNGVVNREHPLGQSSLGSRSEEGGGAWCLNGLKDFITRNLGENVSAGGQQRNQAQFPLFLPSAHIAQQIQIDVLAHLVADEHLPVVLLRPESSFGRG